LRVDIKEGKSQSMLAGSNKTSNKIFKRLLERASTEKYQLFITLTYDQSDYESAAGLYRMQSQERHIRRFIARVSDYLGVNLTGKWTRKLEFTKGGWCHFHVILDSPIKIPFADLTELWGHGHVWVNTCNRKRLQYFCKYISKSFDKLPAYLMAEKSRSIKIIATSPNFYGIEDKKPRTASPKTVQWSVYVPVAESFKPKTLVYSQGKSVTIPKSIFSVLNHFQKSGSYFLQSNHEWLSYSCSRKSISDVLDQTNTIGSQTLDNIRVRGASPAEQDSHPPLLDNGFKSANVSSAPEDLHTLDDSLYRFEPDSDSDLYENPLIENPTPHWVLDYLQATGVFE
jgi:hypothetical protein